MEAILDRLKARNFPSKKMKEGVRVNIAFQDRRKDADIDRDVLLERVNRQTVRGRVEAAPLEERKAKEKGEETQEEEEKKPPLAKKSLKMVLERPPAAEPAPGPEAEAEEEETSEPGPAPAPGPEESVAARPRGRPRKTQRVVVTTPPKSQPPPPTTRLALRTSPYYMSNRQRFLDTVHRLFEPYMKELDSKEQAISCGKLKTMGQEGADIELLVHQRVAKDYLNLYSPYRGLLLYYGLGSGKTLAAITIAEGMKTHKKIIVMTPASLKMNFFTELKRAGDPLYKKNQSWVFVSTVGVPDLEAELSNMLGLPVEFLQKKKGAWLAAGAAGGEAAKARPFADLSEDDQKAVDAQLNQMIRAKYQDINYNAPNLKRVFSDLTDNYTKNPFDNAVVIVDEAHNLVNRIVNQLARMPKRATGIKVAATTPMSLLLYEWLMSANNARAVFLSGTPIINTPDEIAVTFNMLRGYIKTWTFTLSVETGAKISTETLLEMFKRDRFHTLDYVEYSQNQLTVTRNPFGFVNNTTGVCRAAPTEAPSVLPKPPASVQGKTPKEGGPDKGTAGPGEPTVAAAAAPTAAPKMPKSQGVRRSKKALPPSEEGEGAEPPTTQPPKSRGIRRTKKNLPPPDVGPSPAMMDVGTEPPDAYVVPPHQQYVGDMEPHHGGAGQEAVDPAYQGVCLDDTGNITDTQFVAKIRDILRRNGLSIAKPPKVVFHKCLPDKKDAFLDMFVDIDTGKMKQSDVFERRIVGLTSYFRSPQEGLLPKLVETAEGEAYELVKSDMSDYQLEKYSAIRKEERDKESNVQKMQKKKGAAAGNGEELYREFTSTYRIYSRACCNFAWPEPPGRPMARISETKMAKEVGDDVEGVPEPQENAPPLPPLTSALLGPSKSEHGKVAKEVGDNLEGVPEPQENAPTTAALLGTTKPPMGKVAKEETHEKSASLAEHPPKKPLGKQLSQEHQEGGGDPAADTDDLWVKEGEEEDGEEVTSATIQEALQMINEEGVLGRNHLAKYSPKMAAILDNITHEKHMGLHLVYSSFRTLEGIGIFQMVLNHNGFQEFRVVKQADGDWDIATEMTPGAQRYVLYTGTETEEEKEIIRNVYNGTWDLVPPRIAKKLETQDTAGKKNTMGDVIRILMITAAGAEGINLKNTRFVHIMEPYWNMVRVDQVVGRARRICSHEELPPELQTVKVFIYLSVFSEKQKTDQKYLNLMNSDLSRLNAHRPVTTDETLYEISFKKQQISQQILGVVKTSSVDCVLYTKDKKACFGSNRRDIPTNDFLTYPTLEEDAQVKTKTVVKRQTVAYRDVTIKGVKYHYNEATGELYDHATFVAADRGRQPMNPIGKLVRENKRITVVPIQRGGGPDWTPPPVFTPNGMTGVLTSHPTVPPEMTASMNSMIQSTNVMLQGVDYHKDHTGDLLKAR